MTTLKRSSLQIRVRHFDAPRREVRGVLMDRACAGS